MNAFLEGKVIIVTGAGRGYGEQMAKALAAERAVVIVASRTATECGAVADEITQSGGAARATVTDVTSTESVNAMANSVREEFGRIDGLINNAAYPGPVGSTLEISQDEWIHTFDVNLTGSLRCVRAVLPTMQERMSGHIVNLSSGTARLGYEHIRSLGYTTSKYAIEGFSSGLAVELKSHGIRVNAFTPGLAETRFLSNMPPGYLRGLTCQVPAHVGPAIVHLLSGDVPSGDQFEALPWLESQGLLERYSYVHD